MLETQGSLYATVFSASQWRDIKWRMCYTKECTGPIWPNLVWTLKWQPEWLPAGQQWWLRNAVWPVAVPESTRCACICVSLTSAAETPSTCGLDWPARATLWTGAVPGHPVGLIRRRRLSPSASLAVWAKSARKQRLHRKKVLLSQWGEGAIKSGQIAQMQFLHATEVQKEAKNSARWQSKRRSFCRAICSGGKSPARSRVNLFLWCSADKSLFWQVKAPQIYLRLRHLRDKWASKIPVAAGEKEQEKVFS